MPQDKDKKNKGGEKSENMRVTREGLRPPRSDEPVMSDMEKGWPPPWSVSFADMTTNLMCFFVLWYALTVMKLPPELLAIKTDATKIDIGKAREVLKAYKVLTGEGRITPEEELEEKLEEVVTMSRQSKEILVALKKFLEENKLSSEVDLKSKGNEIILSPRDNLFFAKGEVDIKSENLLLLKQVAFMLKANSASVKIEGHTDDTPISSYHRYKYPTNWELSAARAVSVANYLIEKEGIDPARIMVAGYGPSKPLAPNSDSLNRAKNRRVEIHIQITPQDNQPGNSHQQDEKA